MKKPYRIALIIIGAVLLIDVGIYLAFFPPVSFFKQKQTPLQSQENMEMQLSKNWKTALLTLPNKVVFSFNRPESWLELIDKDGLGIEFVGDRAGGAQTAMDVQYAAKETVEEAIDRMFTVESDVILAKADLAMGNMRGTLVSDGTNPPVAFISTPTGVLIFAYHDAAVVDDVFRAVLGTITLHVETVSVPTDPSLYSQQVLPTDMRMQPIDLAGDGSPEMLWTFNSVDTFKDTDETIAHSHVYIVDAQGKVIKHDVLNVSGSGDSFVQVRVIDLGNDGKQELLVEKGKGDVHKYYVFAKTTSGYGDLAIPKAYLRAARYALCPENPQLILTEVLVTAKGIEEHYINRTCTEILWKNITVQQTRMPGGTFTAVVTEESEMHGYIGDPGE